MPSGTRESGGGMTAPVQHGFTVVELMLALAIIAIVSSVAVPGFKSAIEDARRKSVLSSVADAIATARVEAVTRGISVTLCASADTHVAAPSCSGNNNWEQGLLVVESTSGSTIQVWGQSPAGLSVRALGFTDTAAFDFLADGTVINSGTFAICDASGAPGASGLVVTIAGLSRVAVDSGGSGVVESHLGSDVSCL